MTLSLPTWIALLAWIPALVGLGSLVRVEVPEALRSGITGLVGLALLALASLFVNLLVPISQWVALGFYAAGLASLGWKGRWFFSRLRNDGVAMLLLATLAALQPPVVPYDAGLYYLQGVEWVRSHAQVMGLANLHGRFGFNSAWFAVAAALEFPLMRGGSAMFVGGIPVVLAGTAAAGAGRLLWAGDRSLGVLLFALLALPAALGLTGIGSHSMDAPVAILVSACFGLWALGLEDDRSDDAPGAALLLAAFAFTVKISAAVALAGSALVAVSTRKATRASAMARYLGWVGAILVTWSIRGMLASGCWVYPVAATCVPTLRWAVPLEDVESMNVIIRGWARGPGDDPLGVLVGWAWLGPWAQRVAEDPVVQLLGALMACGMAAMAWRRPRLTRADWILVSIAVAGVLFWFGTAPDPRFGLGYLFPIAALPGAIAFRTTPSRGRSGLLTARWLAATVVALTIGGLALVIVPRRVHFGSLPAVTSFWPWDQVFFVHAERNATGTRVLVPDQGDQCWSAPLPCAPSLDPRLRIDGRVMWIDRRPVESRPAGESIEGGMPRP